MKRIVLVAGMPRSGNRLIMRMLVAHGLDVRIRHHLLGYQGGWEYSLEPTVIIVPTRKLHWESWVSKAHKRARLDSPKKFARTERKHIRTGMDTSEGQERRHKEILEHFSTTPTMHVAYEELVSDPEGVGMSIVAFVGLSEWKGWPEAIIDGDEKYHVA